MILSSLRLQNFKNYTDFSFNFNRGLNFIYGNNGNGKTNLLEAISYLCYTKSFLQNSELDCIKYGTELFDITGHFENSLGVNSKVALRYNGNLKEKKFTQNGDSIGRLSSYFGSYPLVVLSPKDFKLTTGTPGDRRRNFDILISQLSGLYFDDLKNLNRIIKQKNALLKDNIALRKYSPAELRSLVEPWNKELTEFGSRIIAKRTKFVREFRPYLAQNFLQIVGNAYEPLIEYSSEVCVSEDENEVKLAMEKSLNELYQAELKRGISLIGPHKDNYIFTMQKKDGVFDVRTFASQGEHKTYIISLKFAEYSYLNDCKESSVSGEPIILLDDIFSDLDKSRIERICSMLPGYLQAFITTTNPDYLDTLYRSYDRTGISAFNIVNGTAESIS